MKVLGIVPSPTDLKWALSEGTRSKPHLLQLPSKSQKLPKDTTEGHALLNLRRLLATFLPEHGIERVCILQAGNSEYRGPSATRVKAEGIIQLVGAELELSVDLVPSGSLRAQEKKLVATYGTLEDMLNGSKPFKPKAWRDAALLAWWGLAE